MSSNLVIVAIPARDEKVWKVSSEKVPHLTLLFLGENAEDVDKLGRIVDFVEHATVSSEFGPFMLDVDERGTLGADDADVLFFRKDYSIRRIAELRNKLLQQNDIRNAYESVDQYPEWQPHLTLGYPETPANEDEMPEHGLNWISFDRIAVWTGDFEGPEFKLRWPERELETALSMSMANDEKKALGIDAVMEHFGVKGMRWGQRKDTTVIVNGNTKRVTAKKGAKLDSDWEKNIFALPGALKVHNAMAEHFNARIDAVNAKHDVKFSDADWNDYTRKSWSPAQKKYMDEVDNLTTEGTRLAVEKVHGKSPTGKFKARLSDDGERILVEKAEVKHAEESAVLVALKVTRNSDGLITKVEPVEDSMEQAVERGAEFIEHFGIKGMKWGVRKENAAAGLKSGAKKVGRGLDKAATAAIDIQFENMAKDGRAANKIERDASDAFYRTDVPKINAKPEYQAAKKLRTRLRHPGDPIVKQYRQELKTTYIKRLEEVANNTTNASGNRQYTIRERGWELPAEGGDLPTSKYFYEVSSRAITHAIDTSASKPFFVELKFDEDGFVTDFTLVDPPKSAEHTMDLGAEFIEHFGIKGMKWGQRKAQYQSKLHEKRMTAEAHNRAKRPAEEVKAYPTIGPSKRTQARVDTKGGRDLPPTEDAIKVAVARQKLKKSGVDALTNTELQEVAKRLELEVKVNTLESKTGRKSLGRQFIESLANDKQNQKKAGDFAFKTAAKRAAKTATVAAI